MVPDSIHSPSAPSPGTAPPGEQPPLWRQLQECARVIAAVRAGQSGTAAFDAVPPDLRPGVQALGFQVLRWLGRAEALRRHLARRTPPPAADALLCTALALAWQREQAPFEPFTLVDQAVEAAKRHAGTRAQASFINACLRRFLRERDDLVAATDSEPVAHWNHPRWWIERLKQDHPRQWQQVLQANNTQAPMTLRVNTRRGDAGLYRQTLLQEAGLESWPVARSGLQLARARPVRQLPGFDEGDVSVQDAAAQLAAPLLLDGLARPPSGAPLRVLDACAAPGGKTAHLLELAQDRPIEVTALEIDAARSRRIDDTLQRLGLAGQARIQVADAGTPRQWWDGRPFDAILLDAPCTASGIVRRHPDVRWLRRESDVEQLAVQQASLLAALWPLVRPGGRLLYCTCSVFRAEGVHQIDAFLAHNTDARLMPSPGHLMPQSGRNAGGVPENPLGDHDGFFYALLERHPG